MGRILFDVNGDHSGHEGWLEYLLREPFAIQSNFIGDPPDVWEGWTTLWAVGIDDLRCAVRPGCDCGWRGPELPWFGGEPTQEQHEALMAWWELSHAGPVRDALGVS